MAVHTKWEILVQKLLKSVELFKSYGLFGERFSVFWKNVLCTCKFCLLVIKNLKKVLEFF